jgi:ABC-type transporter Mla MlaB component
VTNKDKGSSKKKSKTRNIKSKTESVLGDDPLQWMKVDSKQSNNHVEDNPAPSVALSEADDVSAVEFPDIEDLTIRNVSKLHEQLSEFLKTNDPLHISLRQVQHVDTAGIQLLIAFQAACRKQEKPLEWQEPSAELTQIVGLLGLDQILGTTVELSH